MAYKDLREWMARVEDFGELKRIDGVAAEGDIGALFAVAWNRNNLPSILFDNIPGFPSGYRILTTARSARSMSLTLGLPDIADVLQMTRAVREKKAGLGRIPPNVVDTGPILENVHIGDDIDLFEFPVPKWHELDGGPYMGTGDLVITRDPDEGWVNVGTYRVQRHDKNALGFYISPGKHGRIHREKYYAKEEPCPVAVCFGQDPLLVSVAGSALPWGTCEYDVAGGYKGEPIEVIRGPITGLPIPAHAELAIEGYSYPNETMLEGPFGEYAGYYASGARQEPVIRVKSVLHRNQPILLGMPPALPRAKATRGVMRAVTVWDGLERAGIPDIVGVGCYMTFFITVVSIRQRYPGHARQVASVAGQIPGGAYSGRWVIVVDDDIDPTDFDQVLWALATRCDPAESIDFLRRCWSSPLDPMSNTGLMKDGSGVFNSRAVVDACIPYELKSRGLFPPDIGLSKERRAEIEAKYGALLD